MPRTVSDTFKAAAFAQETGEALVVLLTLDHDDLDAPLRFCSDPGTRLSDDPLSYGITSRGEQFLFLPFQITLPHDLDRQAPAGKITVDNIGREMVAALRSIHTPLEVLIEVVLASDPDTVEASFPDFDLSGVTYDAGTIEGEITIDGLAREPYAAMNFDPSRFPALFSSQG